MRYNVEYAKIGNSEITLRVDPELSAFQARVIKLQLDDFSKGYHLIQEESLNQRDLFVIKVDNKDIIQFNDRDEEVPTIIMFAQRVNIFLQNSQSEGNPIQSILLPGDAGFDEIAKEIEHRQVPDNHPVNQRPRANREMLRYLNGVACWMVIGMVIGGCIRIFSDDPKNSYFESLGGFVVGVLSLNLLCMSPWIAARAKSCCLSFFSQRENAQPLPEEGNGEDQNLAHQYLELGEHPQEGAAI